MHFTHTHSHTLSHTNTFTHRRVDTQTLSQTLLHADAGKSCAGRLKIIAILAGRPTSISFVRRVARDASKSQFFLSF